MLNSRVTFKTDLEDSLVNAVMRAYIPIDLLKTKAYGLFGFAKCDKSQEYFFAEL